MICIADAIHTGSTLVDAGADIVVHRQNIEDAANIISSIMKGRKLRYAVDVARRDSASFLQFVLEPVSGGQSHSVGIMGVTKE